MNHLLRKEFSWSNSTPTISLRIQISPKFSIKMGLDAPISFQRGDETSIGILFSWNGTTLKGGSKNRKKIFTTHKWGPP